MRNRSAVSLFALLALAACVARASDPVVSPRTAGPADPVNAGQFVTGASGHLWQRDSGVATLESRHRRQRPAR